MFVANVPARGAAAALRATFAEFGRITKVAVDPAAAPHRTRCAKVFWAEAEAAKDAGRARARLTLLPGPLRREGMAAEDGLKQLVAAHQASLPTTAALVAAADKAMAIFEKSERADAARRAEQRSGGADADGFVTVVHKRKGQTDGGGDAPGTQGSAPKKKKKALELKNFYRHQLREEKKDQLVELRERFKEDKARIAKLKEARVFKAF